MLKVLGKGGYAKVILVKHVETQKLYAMKILKKKHVEQRKQIEHTITERNILVSLKHPFIVRLHHSFQNERKLFFVLEYCHGGELFNVLQNKNKLSEHYTLFYTS